MKYNFKKKDELLEIIQMETLNNKKNIVARTIKETPLWG